MQPHVVYLANSSGLKVGITRGTQVPTRWIDQGASQALPIVRVQSRLHSGLVEVLLKQHVADKTDWRKMLKGEPPAVDLFAERDRVLAECGAELELLEQEWGAGVLEYMADAEVVTIQYPVLEYPKTIKSHNFDKNPLVEGCLMGIKGQYLIFDTGVINIRKFGSYRVAIEAEGLA